eukprot:9153970-Ditylum_brightwellii.AAC.1
MQQEVKRTFKNLTKVAFSHPSLQISSSPIPVKHFYKPGGTMCLAQGKISSRKIDQGCDQYECWSYIKFTVAENKIITIITAYQPCKLTEGTKTTMYHQQLALQQTNSTSKVNPCKSFLKDLMTWMGQGHQKGEWHILAGNFNKPLQSTS